MIPLYDTFCSRRFPVVNLTLVALNILAFLFEVQLGGAGLERFIRTWALGSEPLDCPSASSVGDDRYEHVPARRLAPRFEQHVVPIHFWR